ncbi:MAG TPA: 1,4-dihydroxy-2-naphthoate polyprenyltransferase [Anaerohalosphaeraceae bacterium]|jgi:1,4-dihydroxy-2-naphthoate octaprenyltransferase|nr:1,4-dihydroxy-2-naphthoate polyprenyltransferase [Anaerohalosphaeraceae bacterium]HRT50896.1 1,4-dihydroxy-2-naphthoate polyprenyltransferase [Anaerohalosphaeraceae bacterium]HRT86878.1 1,4-dihydroxy-2-naphthoate polyprenyltransferase [Anaerohalosphaeraceae bacterium]
MAVPKLKVWIAAARPKTLPAAVAPVLIGFAMAYDDACLNVPVLALTFLAALLIQIGTNLANDYYDYVKGADRSDRVGPVRATQAGLVAPGQMKAAFLLTFAAAALVGLYLVDHGGWPILVIGAASLVCAVLYTAGPFPLAYLGLGELFVLPFFGPIAVGGAYYLQCGQIKTDVLIAGFAPGLFSVAILAVNNFRDSDTDRAAGKKTLAVRFGRRFGVAEYIACVITACLVPLYIVLARRANFGAILAALTLAAAVLPVRTVLRRPSPEVLNNVLAQTGGLLLLYSMLFSVGWLL